MLSALLILIGYLALCWLCWYRYRKQQPVMPAAGATEVLVAYASQTGRAAALAQDLAEQLALPGALPLNQIRDEHLRGAHRVLFVVSTYGEGAAPDMGAGFARRYLREGGHNLSHLSYAVLALGDREYPQFCRFGQDLYQGLKAQGGRPLFDLVEMDGGDAQALEHWHRGLSDHMGTMAPLHPDPNGQTLNRPAAPALTASLSARRCLNPGSPGAPTYEVTLKPESPLLWQAGDILSVTPGELGDREQPARDYSIASLPEEGELRLVVRQVRGSDGQLGLGSGWLTERAPLNASVRFRVRSNPNFHAPPADAPLILIGNGTGIAGLRAHLKGRALKAAKGQKCAPNWLLFGERSPEHDALFSGELTAWHQQGHLDQLDLAYSRCAQNPRYVQARLGEHAEQVRRWVQSGAYVYVCGSRTGMAAEVDLMLRDILGGEAMRHLIETHRYRRDIY